MDQAEFNRMFEKATSQVRFEGWDADGPVSGKRTLKRWAGGVQAAQQHAADASKHAGAVEHDHPLVGKTGKT